MICKRRTRYPKRRYGHGRGLVGKVIWNKDKENTPIEKHNTEFKCPEYIIGIRVVCSKL